jgi:hypothetical protein
VAVVVDVDLRVELVLQAADGLAALADEQADLVGLISTLTMRGACGDRLSRGPAMASRILSRIDRRASWAWASASRRMSKVTPVILMSICRAVMPSRSRRP